MSLEKLLNDADQLKIAIEKSIESHFILKGQLQGVQHAIKLLSNTSNLENEIESQEKKTEDLTVALTE